jgi:hypothetical protein
MVITVALLAGILGALGAGALSGIRIGKDALGAELAAYMGALYGFLAGGIAVVATILIQIVT